MQELEYLMAIIGVIMSFGYYPQAYLIWKRKSGEGVSYLSFGVLAFGTTAWSCYGFYLGSVSIVGAFIFGAIGTSLILILKLYYSYQNAGH